MSFLLGCEWEAKDGSWTTFTSWKSNVSIYCLGKWLVFLPILQVKRHLYRITL